MPNFTNDGNGVPLANSTPTGEAGIALESRAISLTQALDMLPTHGAKYAMVGDNSTNNGGRITTGLAAMATAGGRLQMKPGIYLTDQEETFPVIPFGSSSISVSISIEGSDPNSGTMSVVGDALAPNANGLVIVQTDASKSILVTPVVTTSGSPPGSGYPFGNLRAVLRNATFRQTAASTHDAIDLSNAAQAIVAHVLIDRSSDVAPGASLPAAGTGLLLPACNNGAITRVTDVQVCGFTYGMVIAEHSNLDDVHIYGCSTAFILPFSHHPSSASVMGFYHCGIGIVVSGNAVFDADLVKVEIDNPLSSPNAWSNTSLFIYDPDGAAVGDITFHVVMAVIGKVPAMIWTGGLNHQMCLVRDATMPGWTLDFSEVLAQGTVPATMASGTFGDSTTFSLDTTYYYGLGIPTRGALTATNPSSSHTVALSTGAMDNCNGDVRVCAIATIGKSLGYSASHFVYARSNQQILDAWTGVTAYMAVALLSTADSGAPKIEIRKRVAGSDSLLATVAIAQTVDYWYQLILECRTINPGCVRITVYMRKMLDMQWVVSAGLTGPTNHLVPVLTYDDTSSPILGGGYSGQLTYVADAAPTFGPFTVWGQ